jgi:hypothetical protein
MKAGTSDGARISAVRAAVAVPEPLPRRKALAFAILYLGCFIAFLDIQIVSASINEIGGGLSAYRLQRLHDRPGVQDQLRRRQPQWQPAADDRPGAAALAERDGGPAGRDADAGYGGRQHPHVSQHGLAARRIEPVGERRLQAAQLNNQLLVQISQQLADLIALQAANGRAQALVAAGKATDQSQDTGQLSTFLKAKSSYQAQTVQMFHEMR